MAVLEQERHVELVPRASDTIPGSYQSFVVTNGMVSAVIPDELPHLNVFVMTIADQEDPFRDELERVANLADLTSLTIGRDPAIADAAAFGVEESPILYLADSSTNRYDTLETGIDAATAFRDRVSALITDWISFRTVFNAPDPTPAFYTVPVVDPSQKDVLIAAYAAAKQAGYAQLQTKNAADATLVRAQTDYTYKSSLVSGIDTIVNGSTLTKNAFTAVVAQFGSLLTAGSAFYGANVGLLGLTGGPAFQSALSTAQSQQAAMPGYLGYANTVVTDSTIYQTARVGDLTTAASTLATSVADQITQAQALTAANALTAAALAMVYVVCPDFDPTSIPYVPG